ncbi:MAG: septum formation protein Maf [Kiritimatiellae bacterium]|nr:septum formation protein Maf [Kiritimatiellia bacterium]
MLSSADKEIRAGEARLVLGSSSPRRRRLLAEDGYVFDILSPDADEVADADDPAGSVLANAIAKNEACRRLRPDAVILSADTLVWMAGRIFGKPADIDEAAEFLRALSGRNHTVFTAVAVSSPSMERPMSRIEASVVRFRTLDEAAIAAYIAKVRPLDRAGAYDISDYGDIVVERICGSYTCVVGLPMEAARDLLGKAGAFPAKG